MLFLEILKKIFRKKEIFSTELSDESRCISMPKRKNYKNSQISLDKIDNYINEFNTLLSSKKHILSSELISDNLNEKIRMYVDLIFDLTIKDANSYLYLEINDEKKEIIKNIEKDINSRKIEYYLKQLLKLEDEIKLKHIAIEEIYNKKRMFLSKNKRETLSFAMDSLKISMSMLFSARMSLYLERKNSLYNEKPENIKLNINFANNYILRRKNMIEQLINTNISEDKLETKKDMPNSYINYIFMCEVLLEQYVYNNKNKVEDIRDSFNYFSSSIKDKTIALEVLNNIEREYLIYYYFGKNLITDNEVSKVYEIKYDLLTKREYLFFNEVLINENSNKIEVETYKEKTFEKIENILYARNEIFIRAFKDNNTEASKIFTNIMKNNGEYNILRIIKDYKLFNLLLAFDKEDGLDIYFKNCMDRKINYNFNFFSNMFIWNEYIPLETIFRVMDLNIYDNSKYEVPLYNLYKLYISKRSEENDKKYYLPHGISSIKLKYPLTAEEKELVDIIGRKAEDKIVIFPDSIYEVHGNIFGNHMIKDIVLNDGLEVLGKHSINNLQSLCLSIPATTMTIYYSLTINRIKYLYFKDYKKSKIIKNEEELGDLLFNFLYTSVEFPKDNSYGKFIGITGREYDYRSPWMRNSQIKYIIKDYTKSIILLDGDNKYNLTIKDIVSYEDKEVVLSYKEYIFEVKNRLVNNFKNRINEIEPSEENRFKYKLKK